MTRDQEMCVRLLMAIGEVLGGTARPVNSAESLALAALYQAIADAEKLLAEQGGTTPSVSPITDNPIPDLT